MDELGIGISLDIFGVGDELWPPAAAAEGCPEAHAATASASAPAPTATLVTEPGRERPGDEDLDMDRPPQCPFPFKDAARDSSDDISYRRPGSVVDCTSATKRG
jgi:hypothetical protein